jgi:hypothetical protein
MKGLEIPEFPLVFSRGGCFPEDVPGGRIASEGPITYNFALSTGLQEKAGI